MTYSGAATAAQSRQLLGTVLEALQRDPKTPPDVLSVAENIAHAVGALFEAERASSDVDGKSSVRHAMGSLSQTMALLQDVSTRHEGIGNATRTLAEVMSKLYPLAQAPTMRPSRPPSQLGVARTPSVPGPAAVPKEAAPPTQPSFSAPAPVVQAPAPAPVAQPSPAPAPVVQTRTPTPVAQPSAPAPVVQAPAPAPVVQPSAPAPAPIVQAPAPVAQAPAPAPVVQAPAPVASAPVSAPAPARPTMPGEREALEANIGATTESNFFVGFSGDIGEGGVFVATYLSLPLGTKVDLLVTLPGGFQKSIPSTVRFVRDPMDMYSEPGMGVRFDRLDNEARELILRFIRKRPPLFYDE
jgi:uncharacterized protein (TIGR02266 family)